MSSVALLNIFDSVLMFYFRVMKKLFPTLLFLVALLPQEVKSAIKNQTPLQLNLNSKVTIVKSSTFFKTPLKLDSKIILIKGESNINQWESIVDKVDSKLTLHNLKNTSTVINTLFIKIKVTDILSGRKKMDKLTHKALKARKHPYITFFYTLNTLTNSNNQQISGNLTIAGVTKKITTHIQFNKNESTITLKGIHKLDMTDYGVKPPKLFLGALRTKKDIVIDFALKFKSNL